VESVKQGIYVVDMRAETTLQFTLHVNLREITEVFGASADGRLATAMEQPSAFSFSNLPDRCSSGTPRVNVSYETQVSD
jgi:hypothetical protein